MMFFPVDFEALRKQGDMKAYIECRVVGMDIRRGKVLVVINDYNDTEREIWLPGRVVGIDYGIDYGEDK